MCISHALVKTAVGSHVHDENISIVYNTMYLVILSFLLQGKEEPNAEALANIIQVQRPGH